MKKSSGTKGHNPGATSVSSALIKNSTVFMNCITSKEQDGRSTAKGNRNLTEGAKLSYNWLHDNMTQLPLQCDFHLGFLVEKPFQRQPVITRWLGQEKPLL